VNPCRDFEELSLRDYRALGKTYGLEKFWAFHHYHGFPKDCDLKMNDEVRLIVVPTRAACGRCRLLWHSISSLLGLALL
jgi:hypothetical protein